MTAEHLSASPRPDARLVALHAERGDPHARLAGALAALEGADWGLTLAGEGALARQLAALLGQGVLRVDERLGVDRAALAGQGLAAATLDADWTGARAVWLAEPDERLLRRAERAGVPVIVDATLAPGGGWFPQGAALVVYRHAVTLTGFADGQLALLFGSGEAPAPTAPAPADTAVALALRDVATLPLRLARAARTVSQLAERLGGAALPFGPTALLLPPDAAPDTPWPPGGVLAATRSVDGGVVFSPGLQDVDTALALLRGRPQPLGEPQPLVRERPVGAPQDLAEPEAPGEGRPPRREIRFRRDRADRPERFRPEEAQDEEGRAGPSQNGREPLERVPFGRDQAAPPRTEQAPVAQTRPQPDQARPDRPLADAPHPDSLSRVTFEAPGAAPAEEESWTPEIVFSGTGQAADPAPLPIPVSGGPDEPELEVTPPLAAPETGPDQTAPAPSAGEPAPEARAGAAPSPAASSPAAPSPADEAPAASGLTLAPDLPTLEAGGEGGPPDPAADLTDEQAAIYARLREWRNAEARRQEVSRFIIASNATLAEIARRVPYTMDDLKAVKGMGPERLRKYGEKMLEVVRG
ncbi:HRDC domain-containing protein [Deinococcus budaensis]|uniref:HRDC domain-containing protein n=1 Tax=Deinococcus budaensis TaxID=1665626 RepID=A0A7W8GIV9_9DEIO|nr:HRDC domain-containing protein [Deinococcus budaensis]MBB5236078.1 hypothetical protein [Deinococcus budaensis]